MAVGLPNGDLIHSVATGTLSTEPLTTTVEIFDDCALQRSLIATADFCNNGCTVVFTATSATVTHDASGKIISKSFKHPTDRVWPYEFPNDPATLTAANVVRHEINADFVAYSHASFFSPVDTAMLNALKKGWLGNFPRLTAQMFSSDKPNSVSTAKGHLQQTRQKNRSSATKSEPPPPEAEKIDDSQDAIDDAEYPDVILTKIETRNKFLNSSDLPGRFNYISHRGFEYILISVFRGYIHAEPMKSRQAAELTAAYRATYDFFNELGHVPQFQMLDNEDNELLQKFFRKAKVEAQCVPPSIHRRNRAERAIRDWKSHFISGLDNVSKDFLMSLWCELLPQCEITINHLRP